MLTQYHETRLSEPIAAVFAALLGALARGRWAVAAAPEELKALPRTGFEYSARSNGRLRRGQVVECLRPVSIVLFETLQRSPSFVRVQQRWRVQPLSSDTRLSCDLRATLNHVANLHKRNWEARFEREVLRLIDGVRVELATDGPHREASGSIGHSTGSTSIVSAKSKTVNGKPTLR